MSDVADSSNTSQFSADTTEPVEANGADGSVVATETLPSGTAASDTPTGDPMPTFTVMLVGSVTFELPSTSPIMTLIEQDVPYRQLEIPVGLPEAQALAQAIYGVEGVRPGTHELFTAMLRDTATEIVAVRITRLEFGIYYAELDVITPRGQVILDCRPTDAVILALRQAVDAPILCAVDVFDS